MLSKSLIERVGLFKTTLLYKVALSMNLCIKKIKCDHLNESTQAFLLLCSAICYFTIFGCLFLISVNLDPGRRFSPWEISLVVANK